MSVILSTVILSHISSIRGKKIHMFSKSILATVKVSEFLFDIKRYLLCTIPAILKQIIFVKFGEKIINDGHI